MMGFRDAELEAEDAIGATPMLARLPGVATTPTRAPTPTLSSAVKAAVPLVSASKPDTGAKISVPGAPAPPTTRPVYASPAVVATRVSSAIRTMVTPTKPPLAARQVSPAGPSPTLSSAVSRLAVPTSSSSIPGVRLPVGAPSPKLSDALKKLVVPTKSKFMPSGSLPGDRGEAGAPPPDAGPGPGAGPETGPGDATGPSPGPGPSTTTDTGPGAGPSIGPSGSDTGAPPPEPYTDTPSPMPPAGGGGGGGGGMGDGGGGGGGGEPDFQSDAASSPDARPPAAPPAEGTPSFDVDLSRCVPVHQDPTIPWYLCQEGSTTISGIARPVFQSGSVYRFFARLDAPVVARDLPGMSWLAIQRLSLDPYAPLDWKVRAFRLKPGTSYDVRILSRDKMVRSKGDAIALLDGIGFDTDSIMAKTRNMRIPRRAASCTEWLARLTWPRDKPESVLTVEEPFFFAAAAEAR